MDKLKDDSMFDEMAPSYRRMQWISSMGYSDRLRRKIMKQLPAHIGPIQILDLMSGTGENWDLLWHKYPLAQITAIDFSPQMNQTARQLVDKNRKTLLNIVTLDVLHDEWPVPQFDLVVCGFGWKCLPIHALEIFCHKLYKCMKQDACFAMWELNNQPNIFVKWVVNFHINWVMPLLKKMITKSKAYIQLNDKMNNSATPEIMQSYLEKSFSNVQVSYFAFSCFALITGIKK